MDEVPHSTNCDVETESLSFSKRRAMKLKQRKRKRRLKSLENKSELPHLSESSLHSERNNILKPITANCIDDVLNENEEEKMSTEVSTTLLDDNKVEHKKESDVNPPNVSQINFETISHPNEVQIDPSDIMSDVELIKRKIETMFGADTNNNIHKFSESYLQTASSQFIRLLSETNHNKEFDIDNDNLIINERISMIVRNEIMSIFTLIIGIVEGVLFLSLFAVINNSNTAFLQKFASLLVIIQFLSYIIAVLLIPYSFILLNLYTNSDKTINKYQIGSFIVCSMSIFICCIIEFPISDEIYYLYNQDGEYFSVQQNANNMSDKLSKWKKIHIAKFFLLTVIWILCISVFHQTQRDQTKEE